jgi:hypothetical protein
VLLGVRKQRCESTVSKAVSVASRSRAVSTHSQRIGDADVKIYKCSRKAQAARRFRYAA